MTYELESWLVKFILMVLPVSRPRHGKSLCHCDCLNWHRDHLELKNIMWSDKRVRQVLEQVKESSKFRKWHHLTEDQTRLKHSISIKGTVLSWFKSYSQTDLSLYNFTMNPNIIPKFVRWYNYTYPLNQINGLLGLLDYWLVNFQSYTKDIKTGWPAIFCYWTHIKEKLLSWSLDILVSIH